jgi:Mrp family chromosome partitioning ATPase
MRTADAVKSNPEAGRRVKEDLFTFSIRKIVSDVLLHEIKSSSEIKAIAIISPFRNDGKSEISEQLARAFADQVGKTLLLNLQSIQYMGNYIIDPLKSSKLMEESIIKSDKRNVDYLSLDEIGKTCGFIFDKTSLTNLVNQLKNKYKRIIIDTVSLDEDMSGYMAASIADGVYFVCNNAGIRSRQPELYYRKLKEIGVSVLGIIYNNVELKAIRKKQMQNRKKHEA